MIQNELIVLRVPSSKDIHLIADIIFRNFFAFGFLIVEFNKQEQPHEQLLCFKPLFGQTLPHDRSKEFMITEISTTHRHSGYLGTSNEQHFFHTDGAYMKNPPPIVLMRCETAATRGGETILVDSKK